MKKWIAKLPLLYQIKDQEVGKQESRAQRNTGIDILRVFQAIGVITVHVHTDTPEALMFTNFFAPARVPFLFITSLALFAFRISKNNSIKRPIVESWKRLGIPLLAWSIIYASLINVKALIVGKPIYFNVTKIFLYGISSEQMYYLPELIIMQIITLGTSLLARNINRVIALLLHIISIGYLYWGYHNNYYGVQPFGAILVYIVAAFYLAPKITKYYKTWTYFFLGLALLLFSVSKPFFNYSSFVNNYLLILPFGGIGLVLMTLNIPEFDTPKWASMLISTTYGVYLSHVVFLELIEYALEKMHYVIYYNVFNKILMTLLVFFISVIFTLIARKVSVSRIMLLGEKQ